MPIENHREANNAPPMHPAERELQVTLRKCINGYLKQLDEEIKAESTPEERVEVEKGAFNHFNSEWRLKCRIMDNQHPGVKADHDLFETEVRRLKEKERLRQISIAPLATASLGDFGFKHVSPGWWLATNMAVRQHENGECELYFRKEHCPDWPLGLVHGMIRPLRITRKLSLGAYLSALNYLDIGEPQPPSIAAMELAMKKRAEEPGYLNRLFMAIIGRSI